MRLLSTFFPFFFLNEGDLGLRVLTRVPTDTHSVCALGVGQGLFPQILLES